jgi:very-short-patch-repair endonuclease
MQENYIHSHSSMKDRRRRLRNNPTPQEHKLWYYLKGKQLGYKFQRQHSIENYIADFYCHSKKLIIELDGMHHSHNQEYDLERTLFLKDMGFNVLRFLNIDVDNDFNQVLLTIKEELGLIPPLASRGGGRRPGV